MSSMFCLPAVTGISMTKSDIWKIFMQDTIKSLSSVTRVEVISEKGREYVNLDCRNVQIELQDEGKTLKVFVNVVFN